MISVVAGRKEQVALHEPHSRPVLIAEKSKKTISARHEHLV